MQGVTDGRIGLFLRGSVNQKPENVPFVPIFVAWPTIISVGEIAMLRQLTGKQGNARCLLAVRK
jgi:hypothetical protein